MTKLIYIIPDLGFGGAETALSSAIPSLCKEYNFRLICLGRCDPKLSDNLLSEDKKTILTFGRFPLNYLRALLYILKFKPDIIISSLWKAAILGVLARFIRRKSVYIEFIHSCTFFNAFDRVFTRIAIRRADKIFCDSHASKTFVEKWTDKPIEIISFLRFTSPKTWEEKKQIRSNGLYIGRFDKNKRVDRILDFLASVRQNGINFKVDFYGRDSGTMLEVQEKARQLQLETSIRFMGEVSSVEIPDVLQQYDFYIQTSEFEGMAMSAAEAMQQGLVCILTNVGEIQRYAQDGKNALVFKKGFTEELPRIIQQLSKLCSDLSGYNAISKQAYMQFANVLTYSQSLCQALRRI